MVEKRYKYNAPLKTTLRMAEPKYFDWHANI